VTYTPCHATLLNMIEIFFSILTRRMLRRGDFASRDDLIGKITMFSTVSAAPTGGQRVQQTTVLLHFSCLPGAGCAT